MKQLYSRLITCLVILGMLCAPILSKSQTCPDGSPQGNTAFNHSVTAPGGMSSFQVRLPKMNPANGMVTCANLCVTITGILRNFKMENDDPVSGTSATIFYQRSDNITGPGLSTPINSNVSIDPYGSIPLGPNNGVPNSGPDFFSVTNDTIMNTTTICRSISDSATLSQFYGTDSVQYQYNISAFVVVNTGGDIGNMSFSTTALANFRMTYCTCPAIVLPVNVHSFEVQKMLADKAKLTWGGFDDVSGNYTYTAEVSRDGRSFSPIRSFAKQDDADATYSTDYTATLGQGVYYFRIRQVYSNGYTRFSNIRQVELGNSAGPKFSVYPNPSTGIVGIKFDNNRSGQYGLRIFNSIGQVVVSKELSVGSSSYMQVAKLGAGIYWVRLTDKDTDESNVSQIIIK
ncbi:MAG: T9SS type A sorting domain-containing protein [Chitinophagaceae bacterium]|nr:MAG: T9SS type A sorting domain-containing protein [Chitinophagaceae bacterium]